MPKELTELDIREISLVDKAANKRRFFMLKYEKSECRRKVVKLGAADEEKRLAYGIVYEPETVDADDEYATAETIEKACHAFNCESRKIGLMHSEEADDVDLVESYIAPQDMAINGQKIKKGAWLTVTKIRNDEIWKAIKAGEYTGYSMGGYGKRKEAPAIAKIDPKFEPVAKELYTGFNLNISGNYDDYDKIKMVIEFLQSLKPVEKSSPSQGQPAAANTSAVEAPKVDTSGVLKAVAGLREQAAAVMKMPGATKEQLTAAHAAMLRAKELLATVAG